MKDQLQGKSILITGSGNGIGRATALLAATMGAAVAVADVDRDAAQSVAREIDAQGGTALPFFVDISDDDSVSALIEGAAASFGRIDGAFNNAGLSSAGAGAPGLRLADVSDEAFDRLMQVNVYGTWRCMRAEINHMSAYGSGTIVNTASVSGLSGTPRAGAYTATKHAVIGLTRAAAVEYAADGIRINSVCPGPVDTSFFPAANRQAAAERVPLGRPAMPEEIAELAVWLLSDQSSYAVGGAFVLDGGMTAY